MLGIIKQKVGQYRGQDIFSFLLSSGQGEVTLINYGATITAIRMPDKNGKLEHIACGFPHWDDYVSGQYMRNKPYFGSTIGRYCNRIAKGRLSIEGKDYQLACNNGNAHLHGGIRGFDQCVWECYEIEEKNRVGVSMKQRSKHLSEGYPGNLDVEVRFILTAYNELKIQYRATTDQTTVVNLTNHTYFNLSGFKNNCLGHQVSLKSDFYTPLDEDNCCTGEIVKVEGTVFDLRTPKLLNDVLAVYETGYDHSFVLAKEHKALELVAGAYEPLSGRALEVATTEPGMQLYTGYYISDKLTGHNEIKYGAFSGVCFEAQHFPNSPNIAHFPSTLLHPEEEYYQETSYRFFNIF